jgi:hypothetical protein
MRLPLKTRLFSAVIFGFIHAASAFPRTLIFPDCVARNVWATGLRVETGLVGALSVCSGKRPCSIKCRSTLTAAGFPRCSSLPMSASANAFRSSRPCKATNSRMVSLTAESMLFSYSMLPICEAPLDNSISYLFRRDASSNAPFRFCPFTSIPQVLRKYLLSRIRNARSGVIAKAMPTQLRTSERMGINGRETPLARDSREMRIRRPEAALCKASEHRG